ncbi:glycosyltransferase involved in cell wall biosynthesis [Gillisia sp. Hel_I_86]|uniref:glycosyltransferase n=1 Tax=Gillisia sp. Hel_I_86 TaxID=1249981 RepID=UPI0011995ED9|nr:glycosyltransferase [Gillisia sp. Hel_I_86]TVZ26046.1 glycosyltransferase involved in cell wall biosynthesis [Gillisia sp. Hel_I_86]
MSPLEKSPCVSVVMITYSHEKYIREAIESVLMQECDFEVELIVADDKSPDNTEAIVKDIINQHPKGNWIRYIKHEVNKGMMPNFIWALNQAKGKYTALCEGDDYWIDPLKLQKQVNFLESNPAYNFSVGRVLTIDETGKTNQIHEFANPEKRKTYTLQDYITYRFSQTSSFFFRNKYVFPKVFYKTFSGDQALVIAATKDKKIYYHNDVFSHYRINSQSVSYRANPEKRYKQMLAFWDNVNTFTNSKYPLSISMNSLLIESGYKSKLNFFYKIQNIVVKSLFLLRVKFIYKFKEIFSGL